MLYSRFLHYLILLSALFCFSGKAKTCSVNLKQFLSNYQNPSQRICGDFFLQSLRSHQENSITQEASRLMNRKQRDLVMGLLVLAKNNQESSQTLSSLKKSYETQLSKVTSKTKKTSDIYVLKQFLKAAASFEGDQTVKDIADSIQFKEPRKALQRLNPDINYDLLKAAPCMKTLTTTVMQIVSNTPGAVECAKKMKALLNAPHKKNQIIKEYETFASKNSAVEFWVDSKLVPHKSSQEGGEVKMSYKGIMQGVFKEVAKNKKLSNLRVARILAIQGIDLYEQKESLTAEIKEFQKDRVKKIKKPELPEALANQIKNFDKRALKPLYIQADENLLKEIRGFNQQTLKKAKPTSEQKEAVISLLKTLVAPIPEKEVKKPIDSLAIVPYQAKKDRVVIIDPSVMKRTNASSHFPVRKKKEKTAEDLGLVIAPYKDPKKKDRVINITPEIIKKIQIYLQSLQKKQMPKKNIEGPVIEVLEEISEPLPSLSPLALTYPTAIHEGKGGKAHSHDVEEDDDWFSKPVAFNVSPDSKKKTLKTSGGDNSFLALEAPQPLLALPAPTLKDKKICSQDSLIEGVKHLRSLGNGAGLISKKECASHLLERIRLDIGMPFSLLADLLDYPAQVKKAIFSFLNAYAQEKKPSNKDVIIVKDLIRGDLSRYHANKETSVIALPGASHVKNQNKLVKSSSLNPEKIPDNSTKNALSKWDLVRKKMIPQEKKSLKKAPLIKFQNCQGKTAAEMLEWIDLGDLVCSKMALQQWGKEGKPGPLKTLFDRVSSLRKEAVWHVIEARYTGATHQPSPKIQTTSTSNEKIFSILLQDLKKQPEGQLPAKRRMLLSVCKSSLEESLVFVTDKRSGRVGEDCRKELLRVGGETLYQENETPSANEIQLKNEFMLLSLTLQQAIRDFVGKILPNKRIASNDKDQALQVLLDAMNPENQKRLERERSVAKKREERDKKEELDRHQAEEEDLIHAEKEYVGQCGNSLDRTLATLRAAWISADQKKRCAQKALSVLSRGEETSFYKALGQLGVSGTPAQREKATKFVEALKEIHDGRDGTYIEDPRKK